MHIYQIAVVIISALMIYQGIEKYLKAGQSQTLLKLMLRIIVWGGMAGVAVFPAFTNILANIIGLQGNINAVILTGFTLVFLIIFKLLSSIESLEQDISELARRDALKEIKEKD